jgi:hypothetical protein
MGMALSAVNMCISTVLPPLQYKCGLAGTVFEKVCRLCSEDTSRDEIHFLENALCENGYPPGLIF